jgi:hypothetical protein
MKKIGVYSSLAISAFCGLLMFSPLKAYSDSVTMQFTGVGSNSSNETWTADVVTAGSLGKTYEEEASLYAIAVANVGSNTISGAANWADWALGESSTLSGQETFLKDHISGLELTDADADLTGLSSVDLADFANYLVYVPTSDGYSGRTPDGLPQTFVGGPASVTPEPSSLVLFGSGLLSAAGALYRRKRLTA